MFPETVLLAAIRIAHVFEVSTGKTSGDLKLLGTDGKFVDILLKALGAQYKVIIPRDNEVGRFTENGSWTGMIQLLLSGKVDLALSSLSITEERKKAVSFTDPYSIEDATFIVQKKGYLPKTFAYLYPFSGALWMLFTVLIVVIPIPFIFLADLKYSYMKLFLQMFGYVLRQPLTFDFISARGKILFTVWSVYSILISSCYSALLLSFLTIPLEQNDIRTFNELSKAVNDGKYRAFSPHGSSHVEILLKSHDDRLKTLGEAIVRNKWFFRKWDVVAEQHFMDRDVIIGHRSFLRLFFQKGNSKNALISDDKIISCKIAIAMRNDFCCKHKLNEMISRMKNAGIYEKLIREEMVRQRTTDSEEVTQKALSIEDISGSLILLSCGYLISVVALINEIIIHHMLKK